MRPIAPLGLALWLLAFVPVSETADTLKPQDKDVSVSVTTDVKRTQDTGSDLFSCSFDDTLNLSCGFSTIVGSESWKIKTEPPLSSTSAQDHTISGFDGMYLYSTSRSKAQLTSVDIVSRGHQDNDLHCLSFVYSIKAGEKNGVLNVYQEATQADVDDQYQLLFSKRSAEVNVDGQNKVTVNVPIKTRYKLVFETFGWTPDSYIALDDIKVKNGACNFDKYSKTDFESSHRYWNIVFWTFLKYWGSSGGRDVSMIVKPDPEEKPEKHCFLQSPIFQPSSTVRENCFTFWFRITEKNLGSLRVMIHANVSGEDDRTIVSIWHLDSDDPNWQAEFSFQDEWHYAAVNIKEKYLGAPFQIVFDAENVPYGLYHPRVFELDDIQLLDESCDKELPQKAVKEEDCDDYQCSGYIFLYTFPVKACKCHKDDSISTKQKGKKKHMTKETESKESDPVLFVCSFEDSDSRSCGFTVVFGSNPWKLNTPGEVGARLENPVKDHTTASYSGSYVYSTSLRSAQLTSIAIDDKSAQHHDKHCLRFFYYMKPGEENGVLNVYQRTDNVQLDLVFNSTKGNPNGWTEAIVNIQSFAKYRVVFETFGWTSDGYIALDDVNITTGKCVEKDPVVLVCSFEDSDSHSCGFTTVLGSSPWKLNTPEVGAGSGNPVKDHTSASYAGYYWYSTSEASAQLSSVAIHRKSAQDHDQHCLRFFYYMKPGEENGVLNVYRKNKDVQLDLVFSSTKGNPDGWTEAIVNIPSYAKYWIVFETYGWTSDGFIALDDVNITDGKCVEKYKKCSFETFCYWDSRGYWWRSESIASGGRKDVGLVGSPGPQVSQPNNAFLSSPIMQPSYPVVDNCFTFWFRMNSYNLGALRVMINTNISDAVQGNVLSVWYLDSNDVNWQEEFDFSNNWHYAAVNIDKKLLGAPFRIVINGKDVHYYFKKARLSIDIDDTQLLSYRCAQNEPPKAASVQVCSNPQCYDSSFDEKGHACRCYQQQDEPKGAVSPILFDCHFENDFCGWTSNADIEWKRADGHQFGDSMEGDHTYGKKDNYFVFASAETEGRAQLQSKPMPKGLYCLQFFYYIRSSEHTPTEIEVYKVVAPSNATKIFALHLEDPVLGWQSATTTVTSSVFFRIRVEGVFEKDDFLALDDITLKAGKCSQTKVTESDLMACSFEGTTSDSCNFNVALDTDPWKGNTPGKTVNSMNPVEDHTGFTAAGHYIFCTSKSKTKLTSIKIAAPNIVENGRHHCLTFFYAMKAGEENGVLNVYQKDATDTSVDGAKLKLTITKGNPNGWAEASVKLRSLSSYQLVFETYGWASDGYIALDDISVKYGKCSNKYSKCTFEDFCYWNAYGWTSHFYKGIAFRRDVGYVAIPSPGEKQPKDSFLQSEVMQPSSNVIDNCFTFWFRLNNNKQGALRVMIHANSSDTELGTVVAVWYLKRDDPFWKGVLTHYDLWHKASVHIDKKWLGAPFRIVIDAEDVSSSPSHSPVLLSYPEIDDTELLSYPCQSPGPYTAGVEEFCINTKSTCFDLNGDGIKDACRCLPVTLTSSKETAQCQIAKWTFRQEKKKFYYYSKTALTWDVASSHCGDCLGSIASVTDKDIMKSMVGEVSQLFLWVAGSDGSCQVLEISEQTDTIFLSTPDKCKKDEYFFFCVTDTAKD